MDQHSYNLDLFLRRFLSKCEWTIVSGYQVEGISISVILGHTKNDYAFFVPREKLRFVNFDEIVDLSAYGPVWMVVLEYPNEEALQRLAKMRLGCIHVSPHGARIAANPLEGSVATTNRIRMIEFISENSAFLCDIPMFGPIEPTALIAQIS